MPLDHSKNIIEAEHVSFAYAGGQEVLRDVTFSIHEGDYVGLLGPNGSGKTTLLRLLIGLLQPKQGTIKLFGTEISAFREWHRIGYVPQKVTNFDVNFPATVREVVMMGRYAKRGLMRRMTEEDRNMVSQALLSVDLRDVEHRLIGDLSPGQQQRVFIARALVSEPSILFLDEPTTGVDRTAQEEFYALLRKFNRELDLTIVLISHDSDRLTEEAMHIIYVDQTLTCYLTPEAYRARMNQKPESSLSHLPHTL